MTEQNTINTRVRTPRHAAHTTLASIAAIGSVLAASSCCLPVLPFLFATGAAASSAFLAATRPYLIGASVQFIAYGFYQAWRAKRCQRKPGAMGTVLLFTSTVFVAVAIFFPQVLAHIAANMLTR
jgi:cytochrome bd-type quinol oxidase subunit 2